MIPIVLSETEKEIKWEKIECSKKKEANITQKWGANVVMLNVFSVSDASVIQNSTRSTPAADVRKNQKVKRNYEPPDRWHWSGGISGLTPFQLM